MDSLNHLGGLDPVEDFIDAYIQIETRLMKRTSDPCPECADRFTSARAPSRIFDGFRTGEFKSGTIRAKLPVADYDSSISALSHANRRYCPFCRIMYQLLRYGNESCCSECNQLPEYSDGSRLPGPKPGFDLPAPIMIPGKKGTSLHHRLDLWEIVDLMFTVDSSLLSTKFIDLEPPSKRSIIRHISFNKDPHFIHPTQADYFRVQKWLLACEQSHKSCNEPEPSDISFDANTVPGLFGHSDRSLRLIDVETRRVVQTLDPVRYMTLSYVWGDSANRIFPMADNEMGQHAQSTGTAIRVLSQQPKDLMLGSLPRTFQDAMVFTKQLGVRYLWIDALCIPQDQPLILAHQISKMDQIYFQSVCTIVSPASGVDAGLPGASSQTPRRTNMFYEQMPNGLMLSGQLQDLESVMENSAWNSRAWTLQELLLSKRAIFFGPHQVFFVCKEMSANESGPMRMHQRETRHPFLPLSSSKRSQGFGGTFNRTVAMYSTRQLTFPSDKYRAFQGLEARLSRTYSIHFLQGLPLTAQRFLVSLLWRPQACEDPWQWPSWETRRFSALGHSDSSDGRLSSWSWLTSSAAVNIEYPIQWNSTLRPAVAKEDGDYDLTLPNPEIHVQGFNDEFYPLSNESSTSPPLPVLEFSPTIKLRTLALDIDITKWPYRRRTSGLHVNIGGNNGTRELEEWHRQAFPTARGNIVFHFGILPDRVTEDGFAAFPDGTTVVRVLRLLKGNMPRFHLTPSLQLENGSFLDRGSKRWRIRPATPTATTAASITLESSIMPRGSGAAKADTETIYSSKLDWESPDRGTIMDPYNEFEYRLEPDACLLMVEATPPGVVARRLGLVYLRMMDFLVVGADMQEVLLG
ncbi:heterokaryon incompatibility protein-domain-containing protein [Bombardia bombarda]|uniref:Heterokaryon incompatibility protein-domain-containing protein n=1 Tax=Bombardia bombarda TaxID=252184 RepID=A0AA39WH84_9PEZI|nr:heterokaryon incompatibility protein-domain-containing protein [Bombardia bombarda]